MTDAEIREPDWSQESQRGLPTLWLILPILLAGLLGGVVGAMLFDGDDFPADDSADAGFLRDMSTHHAQAVRMASYAYRVSDDEAIRTLAYDILTTQQGQIGIMTGWLDVWGLSTTSADGPMAWMGHEMSGPMPGMATAEELANLESLTGPELDREFLRLMIAHHEGGVGMAEAGVELGESDQVKDLAGAILETQGGETAYMKQMLAERGG